MFIFGGIVFCLLDSSTKEIRNTIKYDPVGKYFLSDNLIIWEKGIIRIRENITFRLKAQIIPLYGDKYVVGMIPFL